MNIPAPGSTVYVRWYGKTLQGEVVPDDHRIALFASMVHVRVPIQGTLVIAVFTPAHVYATADNVPGGFAAGAADKPEPTAPALSPIGNAESTVSSPAKPAPSPSWSTPALDAHRTRYRQFKADHWDEEHNHLRVDALEEFYQLFREGVALRQNQHQKSVPHLSSVISRCERNNDPKAEHRQPRAKQIELSFNFDE